MLILFSGLLLTTATLGQVVPDNSESANIDQLVAIIATEQRPLSALAGRRGIDTSPGTVAVQRLVRLGPKAIDPVSKLLKSEKAIVRTNAAWILSAMRLPEAEAKLLTALDDDEPNVCIAAITGLRSLVKVETRKALWRMLDHESEEVRAAAVRQLAFPTNKPPTRDEIDNYQRNELIAALKPLLRDDSREVRQQVASTLASYCNPNAAELLTALLKDTDRDVRSEAAEGLGNTGNRVAVGPLIEALQDDHVAVAGQAALALGLLGDPRATSRLINLLKAMDPTLRYSASVALGNIGDRRAVEPLIALLADPAENVRRAVATALGQLQDSRAVQPLIRALDPKRREAPEIIRALGKLNDSRAIEPIADALFAESEWIGSITDAVAEVAPQIKHPALVRALAERAIARPKHHSAFISRRIISRLTDRGFDFDHDGFVRWWQQAKSQFDPLPSTGR